MNQEDTSRQSAQGQGEHYQDKYKTGSKPNSVKQEKYTSVDTTEDSYVDHCIPLMELQSKFSTDLEKGLSGKQVQENRNKAAQNRKLTAPIKYFQKIWKTLAFGFRINMVLAAIIFFFTYAYHQDDPSNILLGIILSIVVVFCHKIFDCVCTGNAAKGVLPSTSKVIRDGKQVNVKVNDIVPGDILLLESGDRIPVDCRFISTDGTLLVDFQLYAKEKLPREISTSSTDSTNFKSSLNVGLQGTLVTEGSGKAIALKTAQDSFISHETANNNAAETHKSLPVEEEIHFFVSVLSWIGLGFAIGFFFVSYYGFDQPRMLGFFFAGAVLVAFTPKGLITYTQLAKFFNFDGSKTTYILNRPNRVLETLSNIDYVISDLSTVVDTSQLKVSQIWINRQSVPAPNFAQAKSNQLDDKNPTIHSLQYASILSLDEQVRSDGGDIDQALVSFYSSMRSVKVIQYARPYVLNAFGNISRLLFDSNRGYSLAIVEERSATGDQALYIKGDPIKIWQMCQSLEIDGSSININQQISAEYQQTLESFSKQGETSIGCAKLSLPRGASSSYLSNQGQLVKEPSGMTFIGIISFKNPISSTKNVDKDVRIANSDGLNIVFVTAQSIETAHGICKQANLLQGQVLVDNSSGSYRNFERDSQDATNIIISGERLKTSLKEIQGKEKILQWVNKPICVFAGTDSQTKMELIKFLQGKNLKVGHIIKNEYELLHTPADIKIGSSECGSVMLCRLSDVQIIQDRTKSTFNSVMKAVDQSYAFAENVKKIFAFNAASQMAQIIPIFAFVILRIPLAISPIFMVILSLISNCIPVIALAKEQPDVERRRKIPGSNNRVITLKLILYSFFILGFIATGAGYVSYYTTLNRLGFPVKSLFGMLNMKGLYPSTSHANSLGFDNDVIQEYLGDIQSYKALPANTEITYDMPHWNSLYMKLDTSCVDTMNHFPPHSQSVEWFDIKIGKTDLRKILVYCDTTDLKWKTRIQWQECSIFTDVNYSSPISHVACYTTDALSYAQTSYLLAVILFQFSSVFALKSLKKSFTTTPFNGLMVFSPIIILSLLVLMVEVPGIQNILRTRPLDFWQWGIPAATFSIVVLIHEEIRKFLVQKSQWFAKIAGF